MRVEIIYNTTEAMRLSHIAEKMAADIVRNLQPLSRKIDNENARILFHFGCMKFHFEVEASPALKTSIKLLIDGRLETKAVS